MHIKICEFSRLCNEDKEFPLIDHSNIAFISSIFKTSFMFTSFKYKYIGLAYFNMLGSTY
jgi:hypothetical protein